MSQPVRRNIAHLTQAERDKFVSAIQKADSTKFFVDAVSYWDKQDQIHQGTHVHGQRNFAPWHRELCNRFEALLQEIDPSVALHYWDWTEDPRNASDGKGGTVNLFTAMNFGSSTGRMGTPFDSLDNNNVFAGSRGQTGNPKDPPQVVTRNVGASGSLAPPDNDFIHTADALPQNKQWESFDNKLHNFHDVGPHDYIGGTLTNPHSSFEDPFVFLMHSNLDRIWAMWQFQPGQEWRLDPNQTYGDLGTDAAINEFLEPWSGTVHFGSPIRPWDPGDINNQIVKKTSKDPGVVQPPCYDTLPTSVQLDKPIGGAALKFNDIPENIETVRAVVFKIRTCHDATLRITAGPGVPFGTPLGATVTVPYNGGYLSYAYVWISYKGTTVGATANGSVTIHYDDTGEDWTIPITANTIKKPTVASMLVLDKSGSMGDPSGIPGKTRLQVLKEAAPKFVYLMGDEDAIGIVNFDQDAHPVMDVTPAGSLGAGIGRTNALAAIAAHNAGGATSIGDGLELGHSKLNPVTGYDHKTMIVFTDGQENEPKSINDVVSLLNERVFAVGLGRADQLDVGKLNAVTNGSGGYLLMTGNLGVDDQFRLSKYFMQILAGVTNTAIVTDPESSVLPGTTHKIPFTLTDADFSTDVILLSPLPKVLNFYVETPHGETITPSNVTTIPGARLATGDMIHFYRLTLPVLIGGQKEDEGLWHAVIGIDQIGFEEFLKSLQSTDSIASVGGPAITANAASQGIPYSLSVQAQSNLRLQAYFITTGNEPGAQGILRALLTETDLPVVYSARVVVELRRPDGTNANIWLTEIAPGEFQATLPLTIPGVYDAHFKAEGTTRHGQRFTREEWRTAGVAPGADHQPPNPQPQPDGSSAQVLCCFLRCLATDHQFVKRLGLNPDHLKRCLDACCH